MDYKSDPHYYDDAGNRRQASSDYSSRFFCSQVSFAGRQFFATDLPVLPANGWLVNLSERDRELQPDL